MILTISIPTFNRCELLLELLASLGRSGVGRFDDIEVCISDNCSTDGTQVAIAEYRKTAAFKIEYFRHEVPILGNKNLAFAASRGSGKFVWVIGDDDKVPADALSKVHEYLRADLDYVVLNHAIYNSDFSKIKVKRWMSLNSDLYMSGRQQAMENLGITPTFISAVVARREILNSISSLDLDKYALLAFNQLYAFYSGLPENARGVATAENLLLARGGNSGNYNWNVLFVTNLGIILNDLMLDRSYNENSVRKALYMVMLKYQLPRVLNEAAEGRGSRELRRMAYPYYSRSLFFWCVLFPATFAPTWLMRPVKRVKRALFMILRRFE